MPKKIISGNEAVSYGALAAGVKIVSGYPGTPSTETLAALLEMDLPGTEVEWSTNEKVAFEVAAAGALLGHRTMCTMKMTGVNVAYDALIGIAYTGLNGAMVIYVADDPGVSAGMPEQDTRGFAMISDLPVLEPSNLQEMYDLTLYAFELSEKTKTPVFLRSVTSIAQSHGIVEVGERVLPADSMPLFRQDMTKYTKAGAAICMNQHRDLISRLDKAGELIHADKLNKLTLGEKGGVGLITVGVVSSYVSEAGHLLAENGIDISCISTLKVLATLPYPDKEIAEILNHCSKVLIAEEMEPHLENRVYLDAYRLGVKVDILGKNDNTYSRIGYYDAGHLVTGLSKLLSQDVPESLVKRDSSAEKLAASRPITVCAGCPHRGVYMALQRAIKKLKLKKEDVMITGDIGCTILGSCPPFDVLWTEVAMGTSIPLAQGFVYGGLKTPVVATIGDSTFFHGGIPGLVNALQHGINLTVIIMDNGWTAMTGMQINPGTIQSEQKKDWHQLDLRKVVEGLGVEDLRIVDPYDLEDITYNVQEAMVSNGVSVVLARRECAIQAARRKAKHPKVHVDAEKCVVCKQCVEQTGCPAISLTDKTVEIDYTQCNGCGICTKVCKFGALVKESE